MTLKSNAHQASSDKRPESAGSSSRAAAEMSGMKIVESRELFGRLTEIGIMHEGSLYRLKITRQGKLILNK